jgi:hypothetical protein
MSVLGKVTAATVAGLLLLFIYLVIATVVSIVILLNGLAAMLGAL